MTTNLPSLKEWSAENIATLLFGVAAGWTTSLLMDLTAGVALDEPKPLQSDLEAEVTDDLEFSDSFDPYGGLSVLDLADLVDQNQRDSLGWEDVLPPILDERVKWSPDPEVDNSFIIQCSNNLHPNHPDYREWEEEVELSQLHSDWEPITSEGWAGQLCLDTQVSGKVEDLDWSERRVTFTKRMPVGYTRDPHPCCDGYGAVADWERSGAGFEPEEISDLQGEGFYSLARPWRAQYLRFLKCLQYTETCPQEKLRAAWKKFQQVVHSPEGKDRYTKLQVARITMAFHVRGVGTEKSLFVARETILRWKNYKEARYSHLINQRQQLLEEMELLGDLE